jgi:alkanesulfonate monooxygenase SsuD/methylene tetrahydromethanopterin reductase-like flavin-dependent oxidoreductase (luciferase family)
MQRPHPPILIGGSGTATLRIVAEHADIWNVIGPPRSTVEHLSQRSRALDEQCAAIDRDPEAITRSVQLPLSYEDPGATRDNLRQLVDAGFSHVVLNPPAPYPSDVVRWVTDELIGPTLEHIRRAP